ncbi:thioesterase [Baekduia soli]|uniref:Thioesterase n=1 Tax=Baekduia soli TaxID=496014 RepID=A0A5B8U685_9ACTN|nr:thioesterase [Baekduia soli]QEC48172.1 thioesterase [Baekduia soli]
MTEVHEHAFVVQGALVTDVVGTLPAPVLSTPGLIAMMERAAQVLATHHIPPGTTTVGFEVCIRHVAGAPAGAHCVARATLREIADGRKLRFDVEVLEGDRTLGVGTHERRVVPGAAPPASLP